jgi:uroporphyrinogen decarboxylase
MPIDLGGTESSSMTAPAYLALCDLLGIKDTPRIFDTAQQVVIVGDEVRQRFGIDTAPLAFLPGRWRSDTTSDGREALSPAGWIAEIDPDGSRVVRGAGGQVVSRMPAGGFYYDGAYSPLAEAADARAIAMHARSFDDFDKPSYLDEGWEAMARRAGKLHDESDSCVVANLCVHILAAGQILRGFQDFMIDLVTDEKAARAVMERLMEAYIPRVDTFAEKMADCVDVVLVNDDLGTQGGPMLSPALYRKMIKPYHARLFAHIKKRFGKPLLMHSCGSIYALLGDLIEIGVDAINPVQVSAADMDSAKLKKEFGKDLTFWGGGCDTQSVLGAGTPEDVRAEVQRRIEDLAPGGGFVFTQVHNIQPNVPPRNVVAMLEAALEYGRY